MMTRTAVMCRVPVQYGGMIQANALLWLPAFSFFGFHVEFDVVVAGIAVTSSCWLLSNNHDDIV
jgi:hypothetical protein